MNSTSIPISWPDAVEHIAHYALIPVCVTVVIIVLVRCVTHIVTSLIVTNA
jgi:Flp pilus assembly pilin Flp